MAGRRHHTIPRFLLKGFASSLRGKEVYVWLYRKDAAGVETNINNVGVERDFYGRTEETDLDARMTHLETNVFSGLIDELRASRTNDDDAIYDERIPELVVHLSVRTRQLRDSVSNAMDSMLRSIGDH